MPKLGDCVADAELDRFELFFSSALTKDGSAEDISLVEEKLRDIIAHEEHVRALRQGYEYKLRAYKLSEAITTSRRL